MSMIALDSVVKSFSLSFMLTLCLHYAYIMITFTVTLTVQSDLHYPRFLGPKFRTPNLCEVQ